MKYFSVWEKDNEWERIYAVFNKSLIIVFFISLIFTVSTIFFSDFISILIFDNIEYRHYIILIAFSFPFVLWVSILDAFLKGIKKFNTSVKISISISFVSVITTAILVLYKRIEGAVIAFLLNALLSFLIYFFVMLKQKYIRFSLKGILKKSPEIKLIFIIGIAYLITGAAEQFSLLSIRTFIVKYLGTDLNGIYQSVASISNNYISLFFITMTTYAIPVLSEMKDTQLMNNEVNNFLRFTISFIVPVIAVTFVFREVLIVLFFSKNFMSSKDLFFYNFLGDFFKALTWVFGAWLIPASKILLWSIIALLYHILYFVIFFILLNYGLSLFSPVLAYSLSNFIVCIISYYYLRKLNNFRININNKISLLFSVLFLFTIMITSQIDTVIGYFIIAPLLFIWMKFAITKSEIKELYSLISNNVLKSAR